MKIEVWFENSNDNVIIESDVLPMVGDKVFLDNEEIHQVTGRGLDLRQNIHKDDRLHDIDVKPI